jgi:hypothetical protein
MPRARRAGLPEFRILRRRETVEVEGVGAGVQLRHAVGGIAEDEVEHHLSAVEMQAVQGRHQGRPLFAQLRRQRGKFRPGAVQRRKVFGAEGVLFDGDEMQTPAARRVILPSRPGGEEVEAEAEAGLDDDEALAPLPAGRQAVAGEEDVPCLPEAAGGGVVDVAVGLGIRRAVRGEGEGGWGDHGEAAIRAARYSRRTAGLSAAVRAE